MIRTRNAYPSYKSTKLEWMDTIPAHWEISRLKYIAQIIMGQSPSSDECNEIGLGKPFLQGNAEFGVLSPSAKYFCNAAKKSAIAGDYLLSVRAPVGALNLANQTYGIGRGLCAIRPKSKYLYHRFAYYCLIFFRKQLDVVATGSTYEAVSIDQVSNVIFSIPPISEQISITNHLDFEIQRVEALIAKYQRLIELLQEKRIGIISQAVTHGLNPDVPLKNSGVEWLGEIPVHWKTKKLKYSVIFYSGGTPSKENIGYWDGDIPWVSPKDMKVDYIEDTEDHITEQALKNSPTMLIDKGAVLLVVRSGILRHSIPVAVNNVPVTINQDIKVLDPNNEFLTQYLLYLIKGNQEKLLVEWRKQGATVESIEHELLANTFIPIPPLEEQSQIIAKLDQVLKRYSSLDQKLNEMIVELQEYRSSLISAAVTGKIFIRSD